MTSFIQTNDRLVNLKNVSNINILNNKRRIVFNMNALIELGHRKEEFKFVSDYVYWDLLDDNNFEFAKGILYSNKYIGDRFIEYNSGYINVDEVSSIKFSDKKNRVIFNLSHPITYTDWNNTTKITSEFVFVDFNNYEDYNTFADKVKDKTLKDRI